MPVKYGHPPGFFLFFAHQHPYLSHEWELFSKKAHTLLGTFLVPLFQQIVAGQL
jgi:hypothetical protein